MVLHLLVVDGERVEVVVFGLLELAGVLFNERERGKRSVVLGPLPRNVFERFARLVPLLLRQVHVAQALVHGRIA